MFWPVVFNEYAVYLKRASLFKFQENRAIFVCVLTCLNTNICCHQFSLKLRRFLFACVKPITHQDELRKELELDPELPAVLLMGGGEGMGPVKKTAKALGESLFDKEQGKPIGQLIVICGRNKTLSSSLQALEWKIPVKVYLRASFYSSF